MGYKYQSWQSFSQNILSSATSTLLATIFHTKFSTTTCELNNLFWFEHLISLEHYTLDYNIILHISTIFVNLQT